MELRVQLEPFFLADSSLVHNFDTEHRDSSVDVGVSGSALWPLTHRLRLRGDWRMSRLRRFARPLAHGE